MSKKRKPYNTHWRYDKVEENTTETRSYYSVREVALMFQIEETQLRYWETLGLVCPHRAVGSKARQYTKDDLEKVRQIRYLLVDKGLSLQAISNQLNSKDVIADLAIRDKLLGIRDRVEQLRTSVEEQLKQIDSSQNG